MASICFVIPVYKSYYLLERCILSILEQKENYNLNIIIVDDTPVECRMDIKKYTDYSEISILYNTKNMGVTYSRNKGWFYSTSDYVVFLDSDDYLFKNAISNIFYEINNTKKINLYLFRTISLSSQLVGRPLPRKRFLGVQSIVDTYNSGERLLCLKRTKIKPFISYTRGHEFSGLLRYISNFNDFQSIDVGYPARVYCDDNTHSISSGKELYKRKNKLIIGHKITTVEFLKQRKIKDAVMWYLRYLKLFIR